jgi:hypothetical protein
METLHELPLILSCLAFLLILVGAAEAAFRLGRSSAPRTSGEVRDELGTLQAAVLGLLALLLGFTFSMAATRFEARRLLVVEESNAIGTSYLRTDALPEPSGHEVRALLRQYVDVRLAFDAGGDDPEHLRASDLKAERLQRAFWSRSMAEARSQPRSVPLGLLIAALNSVIDLHAAQLAATRALIPGGVVQLCLLVAAAALFMVGYAFGLARRRRPGSVVLLSFLVTAVIFVIADLDRPHAGMIRTTQQAMVLLRESLSRGSP